MSDWRVGVRGLVEGLAARGVLADPAWRAAFEQVPRHVFVPEFYRDDRTCVACSPASTGTPPSSELGVAGRTG